MIAISYLCALVCGLFVGCAIGATVVRDWLDSPPRQRVRVARLPLAIVLTRAETKRLSIPAIRRRVIEIQ